MKSQNLPSFSAESLGNSLFECFTIDAQNEKHLEGRQYPVMVDAGIICLCLRGEGSFFINDRNFEISQGDMITIFPNSVIRSSESSSDFIGYAIAADIKFMMGIRMNDVVRSYVHVSNHPVLPITEEQMGIVIELCEMLKRKRENKDHPFGKDISRHLLTVLCYEIQSFYLRQMPMDIDVDGAASRQESLCQEFLELVNKYATEHRDMGFYADQLCITPKYLSVIVKRSTGRSPVEWIDRTVMLYARTLLSSSDMTVQQVSAELNFPNASFFGQFFKRHEGVTPKRYRNLSRQ